MDENKNEIIDNEPKETVEEVKKETSNRSNILWILCGAYLVYTGYNLLSGVIKKAEGSSIGFGIAGVIFLVIGAVFAVLGAKRWLDNDKIKKEEARRAEEDASANNEVEVSALKRSWKSTAQDSDDAPKMSIAERAKLVASIDEEFDLGDIDEDIDDVVETKDSEQ